MAAVGERHISQVPTYYPRQRDPPWADEIDVYIAYSFGMVWLIMCLWIPRLIVERKTSGWLKFLGGTIMLCTGLFIVFGIYAFSWEENEIELENYSFTYFSKQTFNGEVGLFIGLRGFNITLTGNPEYQIGQRIRMVEAFRWGGNGAQGRAEWQQGRFCLSAGCSNSIARTFWREIFRGIPRPVLDVAEWFLLDGEYIRWAREYRIAGYYSWVFLWVGLIAWACTVIVWWISESKKPFARGCWVTSFCMISAICIWTARAPKDLYIPFGESGQLHTEYAWSYWCVLGFALVQIPMGALMYFPSLQALTGITDPVHKPLSAADSKAQFKGSGATFTRVGEEQSQQAGTWQG